MLTICYDIPKTARIILCKKSPKPKIFAFFLAQFITICYFCRVIENT